jgi:hypothetical protein
MEKYAKALHFSMAGLLAILRRNRTFRFTMVGSAYRDGLEAASPLMAVLELSVKGSFYGKFPRYRHRLILRFWIDGQNPAVSHSRGSL